MGKRITTGIIGFAVVFLILVYGNSFMVDIIVGIVAMRAMYEYTKCAKNKGINVVSWVLYAYCILFIFLHQVPYNMVLLTLTIGIPIVILVLFLHAILTDMKTNFQDIAFTLFGMVYLGTFIMFFALLYGSEITVWNISGKIAIWFPMAASWGTDVFAYFVGKFLGRHKFSKVSPNKTIEGCVGGTIGGVLLGLIITWGLNYFLGCMVPYTYAAVILFVLSIIGQLGDFSASVVKRYFGVKDFGDVLPGHGGIIDRIDSLIFTAPFAYIIFVLINTIA